MKNSSRVCILGASGYLGLKLLDFLYAEGFDVIIVIRKKSINKLGNLKARYELVYIEDPSFEKKIIASTVNYLINASVDYGKEANSESTSIWTNVYYPIHVLNLLSLRNNGIVFISFDSFYSKFYNQSEKIMPSYVLSKLNFIEWAKIFLRGKSSSIVILYLEHLIGPGESENKFNSWFIKQCRESQGVVELTSGIQVRDFIFVDDILSAVKIVMQATVPDGKLYKYEVGSGVGTSLKDFCEIVHRKLESRVVLRFGALGLSDEEIMTSVAENSKLLKMGWNPIIDINSIIDKAILANS